MKLSKLISMVCWIALSAAAVANQETTLLMVSAAHTNQIVAIVGKTAITSIALNKRVEAAKVKLVAQHTKLPADDVLRDYILERMIDEAVIMEEAQNLGLRITQEDAKNLLKSNAEQHQMTLEEFERQLLATQPMTTQQELYQMIQREIVIEALRKRVINERIHITDSDIIQAIKTNPTKFSLNEYSIEKISFIFPDGLDQSRSEQAIQQVEQAFLSLKAGQSIDEVTAMLAQNHIVLRVDQPAWQAAYQLPDQLAKIITPLRAGDYTDLISVPNGLSVFKLNGMRPLHIDQKQSEQYHILHILLKVSDQDSAKVALDQIKSIKARLDKGEDFATLAEQYSEDTSRAKGGDIGWVELGQTATAFENAFLRLPLNTVSEPVQTQFGWHVIKVLGIRASDTDAILKNIVRQQLMQQNAQEVFSDYLQQLRHSAYIEKRLLH
ncbi:MAG: peptidylprolyl isomerase [Neisseriales bacterium]|nr:MAG: peptidylprolyl isomerase [Neisseriales bacterium]